VLYAALLFVHLTSFAAYLGAGFAQQRLMARSAREQTLRDVRLAYEKLAATILTNIELPAIFGSILSGMVFILEGPLLMKQGWMHGKLTVVLLLAVLSHLEMFNAKAILRIREEGGASVDAAILVRKQRHARFGSIGTMLVLALLILVTFVRLGVTR
jgi:uncharacterized membrane protein